MNTTTHNVINDCRNGVHFTGKLFDQYFTRLDDDVDSVMNTMSKTIHDQFIQSIGMIDIFSDINSVIYLISEANKTAITAFGEDIQQHLDTISTIFDNINGSSPVLSPNLTQSTAAEVRL